jgi:hypothetical protein
VTDDAGGHRSARNERTTELHALTAAYEEDLAQGDVGAHFSVKQLDAEGLALGHAVLPTARLDDCVHETFLG